MKLRPYQEDIIKEIKSYMRAGEKRILVVSPTGSGKTVLVAHMLKSAYEKNKRCNFTVHRKELIEQSIKTFHTVGVKHGVIAAGWEPNYRNPIQISSIQSWKNRFGRTRQPDLIVVDEGHHCVAGSWKKLYTEYPDSYFILLTATPERLDGKGLRGYANVIIEGPSVAWLIDNGFLSKYRAFAPSTIDTSGIKKIAGDFAKGELAKAANNKIITGDAVREYMKVCNGKRAIVFCSSIDHSKNVVATFNAAGIPAEHVDGESDRVYRKNAIRRFADGKTKILSNVELFGEGLDIPGIEAVILLRPTESLSLHLQQIGRSLRPAPGKSEAIILDHAGNLERHGLPDERRCWSLDGKKARKKLEGDNGPKVRTCPKCFAVQLQQRKICQYCGTGLVSEKERKLEIQEGELQEIKAEEIIKRRDARRQQGKAQSMDDLIALGKARGYARPHAWAKYVFNARQRKKIYG